MPTGLLPDPSLEALKEEIQMLRAEAAALIMRRDDLQQRICPELKTRYNREIGTLEYLIFQKKIEVVTLIRMIELMQQSINNRKRPVPEKVQEQVNREYQEYEQKYEKARREYDKTRSDYEKTSAERKPAVQDEGNGRDAGQQYGAGGSGNAGTGSNGKDGGQGDTGAGSGPIDREAELKAIYRRLIRRLHPDINPNVTEKEKELFNRVVQAYDAKDLEALKEIELLLDEEQSLEDLLSGKGDAGSLLKALQAEKERLLSQIRKLQEEIAGIQNSFPYNRREFLNNPAAVEAARKKAEEELADLEEQEKVLRERYLKMAEMYREENGL